MPDTSALTEDTLRPWLSAYPHDADWSMPIEMMSMGEMFDRAAKRFADRPCIDFLDRRYTYGEVAKLVDRAAKGFQKLGVRKGVKVGLCLPNCPAYVISYFGVLKAGGTVVNFNPLYVERELAFQIDDSGTDIMVTLDLKQIYPRVAAMLTQTRLKKIIVCGMKEMLPPVKGLLFGLLKRGDVAEVPRDDRHVLFSALLDNDGRYEPAAVDPRNDVAVLQYTGGTTGKPKGAMLTHANLVANTQQCGAWFSKVEPGQERVLGALPLFHVFAMTVVMNMGLWGGAELILLPRFDLDQVMKVIDKKHPTLFPGVPTMYRAISAHPKVKSFDLSSIKFCISGGAPLPIEVKHAFESLTGCVLVEGYGLSEASPVTHCNPISGVHKEGSIGLPLPGTEIEIRSLDDVNVRMPKGEKGEVCLRGPQVMAGYWQRADETAGVLIEGGWLRTGDVGYMDEQGYTFLVDRLKDLIISGGYNVYPRVIEEAIYLHPAVFAVTVIGIPDDYRGQSAKAFVQLKPGMQATEEEMKAFLSDKLSKIEMPREIEFREDLPKTLIGKLSKKELVAEEMAKRT